MTVSAENNATYITTEDGTQIGIGTPDISVALFKTTIIYSKYQISIGKDSVTLSISIPPSPFGTAIEVPFDFLNQESINLVQEQDGETISAGNIYNKEHKSIGIISTQVKRLENINITQKMNDNQSLSINVAPNKKFLLVKVEITASNYSTYFSGFSWINRSGQDSLSLTPKRSLSGTEDSLLSSVKSIDAWDKVVSKHGKDVKWSNYSGLKNQFHCHYNFAKEKQMLVILKQF